MVGDICFKTRLFKLLAYLFAYCWLLISVAKSKRLHSVLHHVVLVKDVYYGDVFCGSKKCLAEIKPSEINALCRACENNGKSSCVLVFEM